MIDKALNGGSNRAPGRGRIYDSIADTIGDTPIVRLEKLARMYRVGANLLAKLEFFNPIASVKDRIGLFMIEAMQREGRSSPGKRFLSSRPRVIQALHLLSWPQHLATGSFSSCRNPCRSSGGKCWRCSGPRWC